MDLYAFAVAAIPALWVALGLLQPSAPETSNRRDAMLRTVLRVVLAAGEVSAVTTLAVGHDGYLGAISTVVALVVGTTVLAARAASSDLQALGIKNGAVQIGGCGYLLVIVLAYSTVR